MTVRKWLAAAAVGTLAGGAPAADPAKPAPAKPEAGKAVFSFGSLKPMPADAAKAKVGEWLKAAGKLDQGKLDAAFANESRSVADRTVAGILLGLPEAAAVLDDARRPDAPAPTAVPPLLADPKADPFVRANLAAAYAKALGTKRVYEEALDALKGVAVEQVVDPAAFYFYKAVAEHALGVVKKEYRAAVAVSIARLLDDVADAPDRYKVVATMMFFDVQAWAQDDKDLANITRLMDNSGRRLDLARGGAQTQDIQKRIVFNLDQKIKEMEDEANKKKGSGQGPPGPGQPGPASGPPTGPAADSTPNGGMNGKGEVDMKKLRSYEATWGTMPPAKRQEVILEITRDLPAKYKPMIEDYFRTLNKMHGVK